VNFGVSTGWDWVCGARLITEANPASRDAPIVRTGEICVLAAADDATALVAISLFATIGAGRTALALTTWFDGIAGRMNIGCAGRSADADIPVASDRLKITGRIFWGTMRHWMRTFGARGGGAAGAGAFTDASYK
jgi:hypothetical protein